MRTIACRFLLILAILGFYVPLSFGQTTKEPLSERELLALVAGNALSENIVHEIETRGLEFPPGDQFRLLVTEAGADSRIIAALNSAKTSSASAPAENDAENKLLQHLAQAGKFVRNKQYGEATHELTAALQNGGGTETGFVMAEVLRAQEQWSAAEAILREVQRQAPDFPEAHTKLSYILYRINDGEGALSEARIALAENPNNAEAHKNAGLALQILQKYSASEQQYQEAFRLKPDYASVRYGLGMLFHYEKKYDQAIVEYKKAITLDPANGDIHYNRGLSFEAKGDLDSAIHEYREAIRLEPTVFALRESLGHALEVRGMYPDAVKVFREMGELWPDSPICHDCLGNALYATDHDDEAVKEFHKAIALDPTDAYPHQGLGRIRQEQKDYDGALNEFRQAEKLDETSAESYLGAGTALFSKKDFSGAIKELKQAEYLKPSDVTVHDFLGQSLTSLGDTTAAIAEFKQAVALDPKRLSVRIELAAALEAQGDWVASLKEYRQAAQSSIPYPGTVVVAEGISNAGAQAAYQAAQARFRQHIASLKASGKPAEAEALESAIHETKGSLDISGELDAAILKGRRAAAAGRFEEVGEDYTEAVVLAEKIQPRDDRLKACLLDLANFYAARKDFGRAEAAFQRALKVTEELHGTDSPELTSPLQSLGHYFITRQDYSSASDFYSRAVTIDEKAYGETSNKVADSLRQLSFVYLAQKDYAHAEPYLLRAQRIIDSLVGPGGDGENLVLWSLCNLYDKWDKPDKADPRYRQMLAILEKQYGPESPVILSVLTTEARMLRELGRTEEAAEFERRAESIRAATGTTDSQRTAQLPN
jgi:tetratricopeptide (TPR) repeat protein